MNTTWPQHLAARFEKEQPRKLLALDGGGIRGVLARHFGPFLPLK